MKRRVIIGGVVALLLVAALGASTLLIAYTDRSFICENSGSRMSYREWPCGIRTNEQYRESKLERFMKNSHPEIFRHRWTSYAGRGSSLIPGTVSNGHGRPGPIYSLQPETLDDRVDALSDHERLALYQTFSNGDRDECQSMVDELLEKLH